MVAHTAPVPTTGRPTAAASVESCLAALKERLKLQIIMEGLRGPYGRVPLFGTLGSLRGHSNPPSGSHKIKREHLLFAEVQRQPGTALDAAGAVLWDCPAPGCSKWPDRLFRFGDCVQLGHCPEGGSGLPYRKTTSLQPGFTPLQRRNAKLQHWFVETSSDSSKLPALLAHGVTIAHPTKRSPPGCKELIRTISSGGVLL